MQRRRRRPAPSTIGSTPGFRRARPTVPPPAARRSAGEVVESFDHGAFEPELSHHLSPTPWLFGRTRADYRALGYKFPVKFINVVGCDEAKVAVVAKITGIQGIGAPTQKLTNDFNGNWR